MNEITSVSELWKIKLVIILVYAAIIAVLQGFSLKSLGHLVKRCCTNMVEPQIKCLQISNHENDIISKEVNKKSCNFVLRCILKC